VHLRRAGDGGDDLDGTLSSGEQNCRFLDFASVAGNTLFLVVSRRKAAFRATLSPHGKISKNLCVSGGLHVHEQVQRDSKPLCGEQNTAVDFKDDEMKRPTPFGSSALVDAEEISQFLGCSPKHVRRMAERGDFPKPVKVGRLRRWPRQAVEQWLESQQ